MTREEHIIFLETLKTKIEQYEWYGTGIEESLNAAIEALRQEPCEDAISREAALETIKSHSYSIKYDTNSTEHGMTVTGIEQALNELPSVVPAREKGKWIEILDGYVCSKCNLSVDWHYNFCPNCGSDNREAQDG